MPMKLFPQATASTWDQPQPRCPLPVHFYSAWAALVEKSLLFMPSKIAIRTNHDCVVNAHDRLAPPAHENPPLFPFHKERGRRIKGNSPNSLCGGKLLLIPVVLAEKHASKEHIPLKWFSTNPWQGEAGLPKWYPTRCRGWRRSNHESDGFVSPSSFSMFSRHPTKS